MLSTTSSETPATRARTCFWKRVNLIFFSVQGKKFECFGRHSLSFCASTRKRIRWVYEPAFTSMNSTINFFRKRLQIQSLQGSKTRVCLYLTCMLTLHTLARSTRRLFILWAFTMNNFMHERLLPKTWETQFGPFGRRSTNLNFQQSLEGW